MEVGWRQNRIGKISNRGNDTYKGSTGKQDDGANGAKAGCETPEVILIRKMRVSMKAQNIKSHNTER